MRRARPVGDEPSWPQQQQAEEAAAERRRSSHQRVARSVSPALKLVTALILIWALYISAMALGKGQRDAATGHTTAVEVRTEDAGGSVHVEAGRGGVRELSMLGFEKGGGDGGEWRTCRAYQEDKLAKHKTVS